MKLLMPRKNFVFEFSNHLYRYAVKSQKTETADAFSCPCQKSAIELFMGIVIGKLS